MQKRLKIYEKSIFTSNNNIFDLIFRLLAREVCGGRRFFARRREVGCKEFAVEGERREVVYPSAAEFENLRSFPSAPPSI